MAFTLPGDHAQVFVVDVRGSAGDGPTQAGSPQQSAIVGIRGTTRCRQGR